MAAPAPIYFDYNATTPLDPEVRAVVVRALDEPWGNASSIHRYGRLARATLDDARDRVASLWNCKPSEVIFTSGGTEANNLAVLGAARAARSKGRHLLCSPTEHHAVLHAHQYLAQHEGFDLSLLPVDANGRVHPDDVASRLRPETVLVSVMAANNETGVVQPFAEIGRLCRSRGVLFHTDAVQYVGKSTFNTIADFEADLVTVCAHKIHGPKGAGALYARSPLLPVPLLLGGAHEYERRAGTENLPAILGLVEALVRFAQKPVFDGGVLRPAIATLQNALERLPGVVIHAPDAQRLCNTLAFSVANADSVSLLAALDLEGLMASSGSACSAGSLNPSHVLAAMGVSKELSASLVRLSLGRETTEAEISRALAILERVLSRFQGQTPTTR